MVVLTGEAAVQHQRAVDLLHDPSLRLRNEAFALVGPVAADDLDVDAGQGAMDEDLVLEALVHQSFLQAVAAPLGSLVPNRRALSRTWQRRSSEVRWSRPSWRHRVN